MRLRLPGPKQARLLDLACEPSSGGQLCEAYEQKYGEPFKTAGLSTTLKRMCDVGWLRVTETVPTKFGPMKLYQVTDAGAEVLATKEEWLSKSKR